MRLGVFWLWQARPTKMDEDQLAPNDLASLPELNDEAVLAGIRRRFEQDKIYTQINNLLIQHHGSYDRAARSIPPLNRP